MSLPSNDISFLVDCLTEKDDIVRYHAFLVLQEASRHLSSVYPYWNVLESKLGSDNSYQRSIGLMLIAENVKWDKDGKFSRILDGYLARCTDEKFITARQAIQGLTKIVNATAAYNEKVAKYLTSLSLSKYQKNQQTLLNKDILRVLRVMEVSNPKKGSDR